MSTRRDLKAYRFATQAQWEKGVFSKIRIRRDGTVIPEQPLAPSPRVIASPGGAFAPAISPHGVAYWRTGAGFVQWMEQRDTEICSIETSTEIANSPRLAIGKEWMWAFQPGTSTLIRYDLASLQEDDVIRLNDGQVRDIATDGSDGVWVLVGRGTVPDALRHVDTNGRIGEFMELPPGVAHPRGITYLSHVRCVAVLTEDGVVIELLDPQDASKVIKISLQQETPGFRATLIDSNHKDRLVVGGTTDQTSKDSAASMVLLLDSSGGLVDQISKDRFAELTNYLPITGATAHGTALLVTTANGILWFDAAPAGNSVDADGLYLTPVLHSPETGSLRGWLRAEFLATLPKGAALSVSVMSTDDPRTRDEVVAISKNASLPPRSRLQKIASKLEAGRTGPFVFVSPEDDPSRQGSSSSKPGPRNPSSYAVPLFDHQKPWLWLEVRLNAAPDGQLPALHELRALYPEVSLSQHVPAIFRGDVTARDPSAGDPTGFFRQLVGLLETTTQGIDSTIASLGSQIHPGTARGEWLDFIARWLDLPWDDALPEDLKRRILGSASVLLAQRGTRAGLKTLLSALFPAGKFRVIDLNVEAGLATVGGERCQGSALPAILSGLPPSAAVLSRKAVLGHARVTCPNDDPIGAARFIGLLRIEIFANDAERKAVGSVLAVLLAAMTPAGLRTQIRWRPGSKLRMDNGITLDDPSPRRVGQDARLGVVVLAGGRYVRLTDSGLTPGFRLN